MRNILIIACMLLYMTSSAQLSFHSTNQAGLIEGEKGSAFQLQSINGFAKKFWFAGLGAGLDYYHTRTVPVFIDVRRNILKKDKSPFVYADAGISFPWVKNNGEYLWYKEEYKKGNYFDVGVGYNLPVNKLGDFVLSIGYSEKKLKEERYNYNFLIYSGVYEGTTNKTEYNYCFRRILIKAGFRF